MRYKNENMSNAYNWRESSILYMNRYAMCLLPVSTDLYDEWSLSLKTYIFLTYEEIVGRLIWWHSRDNISM